MADIILQIKIPEAMAAKALEGYLKIYPNSATIPDPNWVDPQDGSVAPQIPKYTNRQWVTKNTADLLERDTRRGFSMIRNEAVAQVEDTSGMFVAE